MHSRSNWRPREGLRLWIRRVLELFSGKAGPEFTVKDTDGKVVTSDQLPSLSTLLSRPGASLEATAASSNDTGRIAAAPAGAATAPLATDEERHGIAARRKELTEF